MRLTLSDFTRGLWLLGGKETTMKGYLRRARGVHELRTPSLRSRNGCVQLYALNNIDLIAKFNDTLYFSAPGVSTRTVYRTTVTLATGLDNAYSQFVKLPPQPGTEDWLFMTNSATPKKISTADVVENWGIAAPSGSITAVDGGAGTMAAGVYSYHIVFLNENTGSRSNPTLNPQNVSIGASRQVSLSNIPTSPDSQVTAREIYRTTANGARYFLRAVIANNTATTFTDNGPDTSALQSFELQFDNVDPANFRFRHAWVTQDQRMWWTNEQFGTSGYAYYSPPGRPESVRGFVVVSSDDEPLRTGLSWNGVNWLFSTQRVFRIVGDSEPFVAVPVNGVPGLANEQAVAVTPYGIAFVSYNGVYLFDGARASLIGFDELAPIFRGEEVENLDAVNYDSINNLVYANEQLYFTMGSGGTNNFFGQTLIYSFRTQTWRELGRPIAVLYKEQDSSRLVGSFADAGSATAIHSIEQPGTTNDGSGAITLAWEVGGALTDIAHQGVIQRVYLDLNTGGTSLAVTLVVDNTTVSLGNVSAASRTLIEFPVPSSWQARVFSVRITGTTSTKVELFNVAVDVKLEGSNRELGIG